MEDTFLKCPEVTQTSNECILSSKKLDLRKNENKAQKKDLPTMTIDRCA